MPLLLVALQRRSMPSRSRVAFLGVDRVAKDAVFRGVDGDVIHVQRHGQDNEVVVPRRRGRAMCLELLIEIVSVVLRSSVAIAKAGGRETNRASAKQSSRSAATNDRRDNQSRL